MDLAWNYFGPVAWQSQEPLPAFSWDHWQHLYGRQDEMHAAYLKLVQDPQDSYAREMLCTLAVPIIRSAIYSQLKQAGHRGSYDGEDFLTAVYTAVHEVFKLTPDLNAVKQTIGTSIKQATGLLDLCGTPTMFYPDDHPLGRVEIIDGDWDSEVDEARILVWKIRRVSQRLARNLIRNRYRKPRPRPRPRPRPSRQPRQPRQPRPMARRLANLAEEGEFLIDRLRAGYKQKEIAAELGCHPGTISRWLKKILIDAQFRAGESAVVGRRRL